MTLTMIISSLLALTVMWRLLGIASRLALPIAVLVVATVYGAQLGSDPGAADSGRVVGVADGDTLTVSTSEKAIRVRLLGIDAPESSTLRFGHAECAGQAAARNLRRLARPAGHGIRVRLITDPASGDVHDRHGRLLAYAEGPGGDLGEAQLRAGQATVYRYDGRRFSRLARYQRAQDRARAEHRGAWRTCDGRWHARR